MENALATNDSELLNGLKKGNIYCFEILFKKHKGRIYNFIMNVSQDDFYLAEEIVQNVFIKVWEIRKELTAEGSFSTLLYVMAKNMYYNYLRKRVQERLYETYCQNQNSESCYNIDQEIEYRMLEEEILKLIDKLPPARKKVYQLSRRENRSNKEIAGILRISENTVEAHLTKANSFLRHMLSGKYIIYIFLLNMYSH